MKRLIIAILIVAVIGIIVAACGEDLSKADIDQPDIVGDFQPSDYEARAPDKLTVFLNVDNHPTIARVCIDGVAFRTISTNHSGLASPAVERVEEWDSFCDTDN